MIVTGCRLCMQRLQYDSEGWQDIDRDRFSKMVLERKITVMGNCPKCLAKVQTQRLKKIVEQAVKYLEKKQREGE